MDEVSKMGRTVIFVSHQMGSIAQLCQKAILLEKGYLVINDKTDLVIDYYLNHQNDKSNTYLADDSAKHKEIYIETATVLNDQEVVQRLFGHNENVIIRVSCVVEQMVRGVELRMIVRDNRSITIFTTDAELHLLDETTKSFQVDFNIPGNTLRPKNYILTFGLFVPNQFHIELIENVISFSVFDNGTKYAQSEGLDYGVIFSPCKLVVTKQS